MTYGLREHFHQRFELCQQGEAETGESGAPSVWAGLGAHPRSQPGLWDPVAECGCVVRRPPLQGRGRLRNLTKEEPSVFSVETSVCQGKEGPHSCVPGTLSPSPFLPSWLPTCFILGLLTGISGASFVPDTAPRGRAETPSGPQGCVNLGPKAWRWSGVTCPFRVVAHGATENAFLLPAPGYRE